MCACFTKLVFLSFILNQKCKNCQLQQILSFRSPFRPASSVILVSLLFFIEIFSKKKRFKEKEKCKEKKECKEKGNVKSNEKKNKKKEECNQFGWKLKHILLFLLFPMYYFKYWSFQIIMLRNRLNALKNKIHFQWRQSFD